MPLCRRTVHANEKVSLHVDEWRQIVKKLCDEAILLLHKDPLAIARYPISRRYCTPSHVTASASAYAAACALRTSSPRPTAQSTRPPFVTTLPFSRRVPAWKILPGSFAARSNPSI